MSSNCPIGYKYKQYFFQSVMEYDIPMSVEQCRSKLRDEFVKHRQVTDIRVIDMLVIKVSLTKMIFVINLCSFNLLNRARWS